MRLYVAAYAVVYRDHTTSIDSPIFALPFKGVANVVRWQVIPIIVLAIKLHRIEVCRCFVRCRHDHEPTFRRTPQNRAEASTPPSLFACTEPNVSLC